MATNRAIEASEFLAAIRDLETALAKIQSEDGNTSRDGARWFMSAIYEIGRALHVHPQWSTQPAWQDLIATSAPILSGHILAFSAFYRESTDVLERAWEWGEEWICSGSVET